MTVYKIICLIITFFICAVQGYTELSDDEYYSLPSAYHLDDYTRCSRITDGIYCVGRFLLQPIQQNNYKYQLMQKLSASRFNYNHTLTYQGLCLTSTCAHIKHKNHTYRFEQCVNEWANTYDMTSSLHEFHYCHTHHDIVKPPEINTPKLAFLGVTAILICLNVIGTLHDYSTRKDQSKRNNLLMAWSIPANWSKLTTLFNFKDPKMQNLETLQGLRFLVMLELIVSHISLVYYRQGSADLRHLEEMQETYKGNYMRGILSCVLFFFTLASFLVTYMFLRSGKSMKWSQIPEKIFKRLFRVYPMYLYCVAFAATWWVDFNHSPNWPVVVHAESQACQKKFWLHVFFLNNLFSVDDMQCLVQTWGLAAECQLFIVLMLILTMFSYFGLTRKTCIRITAGMIAASIVLNYVLGYIYEWKPMEYLSTPEALHKLFYGSTTFGQYYVSPWGSLPGTLAGLLLGYLLYDIQENGFKLEEQKWFVVLYHLSLPMTFVLWPLAGALQYEVFVAPHAVTLQMISERGISLLFMSALILGSAYGIETPIKGVLSLKFWQPIGNLALGHSLAHWFVLMYFIIGVPMSFVHFSNGVMQGVGSLIMSFVVATPLVILLELPMSKSLNLVFYKTEK